MHQKTVIEVDTKTFLRFWLIIFGLILAGLFIWKAAAGLIIVGIAAFLSIAIQPLAGRIKRLTKKKDSSFASVMAYVIIIVVLGIIAAVVVPVVVDEMVKFVNQLPAIFQNTLGGWDGINGFGRTLGIENLQGDILSAIESFSSNFVSNIGSFLMNGVGAISQIATSVILTLVLTLLFAIEGPAIMKNFWNILEGKHKNSSIRAYQHLAERIGGVISTYVSKQVTVAILDGVVVGAVIFLLSLIFGFSANLAIPLGLTAFILYLIPMFGPIISCILISLLLVFSSPVVGIIYLIFYIVYAQIENNVIAPKLQGDALNIPTALILTAIIIGMYTFGLIGAIISIPIAGCIKVILEELPALRGEAEVR